MTLDVLLALVGFAFVTSITPGPNNLMLMASGANFGFRRTVPHMLGVALGFVFLAVCVGAGLIRVFDLYPAAHAALKIASTVYMLYLAWRIATAAPRLDGAERGSVPLTFTQAAVFQWVNPKAWAMALTAVSVYAPAQSIGAILQVAAVFGAVNLPSVSTWTVLGQQMRRLLRDPRKLHLFNLAMAVLLVASLVPVLLS